VWFAKLLLRGLLPVGCFALLAWLSHGPAWAWAVAALGCTLLVCVHARQSAALAAWLDAPESREFPKAGGAWGEILRQLADKLADETRGREEVEARLLSFRGAMDAVPDGLVILDADHRIQWSNRAAERASGNPPAAR
jgi:two-component system phosphate regulon sensor histidine kinase PhoR